MINNLKDSFLKNSLLVLAIRLIGVGLSFCTILLITNFFSEELVGQFNYLNSILIVFGALILIGMNDSFLQFSGKLDAKGQFYKVRNLYFKKLKILLVTTTLLCVVGILSQRFIDKQIVETILFKALFGVFFYALSLLNYQVIRGLKKLRLSEIFRNIVRYGVLLILIGVIIYTNNYELLLDVFIGSFMITGLISFLVVIILLQKLKHTPQEASVVDGLTISYKEIVRTSFPMTVSFLSLLIMQSVDVLILKSYFNYEIIAYYGVVIKISTLTGIVLLSTNAMIAPHISELYFSNQFEKLHTLINKSIKINFILTVPIILFLVCFSEFILSFFGENYIIAKHTLIIVLVGQIANAMSGSVGIYLNMTGRQKVFQKILLVALVLNVILNLILIPKYDMIGAAISTAISLVFLELLFGILYL